MFSVIVGVATFIALVPLSIAVHGLTAKSGHADAALVFGNTVERTGLPSKRLAARLDAAHALFAAKQVRWILVSGGVGKEGFDEAHVMQRYLHARAIPDSALIEDAHGINTLASCVDARILLAPRGARSVVLVTQWFHLLRARVTAERAGLVVVGASAPHFFEPRDAWSLARETVGLPVYVLRLALMRHAEVDPAVIAQADLDEATRRYADCVLRMDSAGIAAMFTEDGEMVDTGRPPTRGPLAIRTMLEGFAAHHVLEESMVADSVRIAGDQAFQAGAFRQLVRLPDGNVVIAHGRYASDWVKVAGAWRIRRMATAPGG